MSEAASVALTFLGGAGTVTGSRFLIESAERRLLVDCGLYQGERRWRRKNWDAFPVSPRTIDDVVLTHCHLDHCGFLPVLVRDGYEGSIRMTEGTAALTAIVLRDSANLQERDADMARAGGWSRHDPPLPLYTVADAERAIERFETVPFDVDVDLGSDAGVRLHRAGHVLGSASVLARAGSARVLFSGDLGRTEHPVLRPRADPPAARTVVIESTYGDREHREPSRAHAAFADAVRRTIRRGGVVLVPAFAVDRTELVLHALSAMVRDGQIPPVPVFVDSPMALAALDVYGRAEVAGELREGMSSFVDLPSLHAARTPEESMRLNSPRQPCIIVSASGMASGGRVVHHLRHLLPDRRNCVVLTGYQAVGTRGSMLRDGAREVKMMGRYVPVKAEIVEDQEFSVHADASELVDWLRQMPEPPEVVYVVHGEEQASAALAGRIRDEVGCVAVVPRSGEKVLVD
ncbi:MULTISPECIES: MBL fold metallo-hydrolase RNA specificity domain-containing protein [unclassified Isoptericola]|uniref:MBL fold metallo-hydrolase RNA specificity domain-containing protein n=1 Tax=unclassified Isoptericola TaxID=2623355 RepID=UPI002712F867|nr:MULTISPECIES: MBL fold metallo-hydrolase [unclassified Isoptericola]MDO8145283.1 MBL fold metallo-hydrolase [Isoptericola sp. 178]MDO8148919.1 MBL fold metallo-hydrolase [Isoptericola sp. b515]MDO8151138.1 MBL fold metallo-hydrolase [Isoptericola sp. b408]